MIDRTPRKRSERSWRKSLLWKLTRIFLIVSAIGAIVHFLMFWRFERFFSDRFVQTSHWEIAAEYAAMLEPLTTPKFRRRGIEKRFFKFRRLHPLFDAYLLDEEGNIVFSSYHKYKAGKRWLFVRTRTPVKPVPLEPLRVFLETKGYPVMPIYGFDPLYTVRERKVPISVASILIEGKPGYVYVLLRGDHFRVLYQNLGDFTLSLASAAGLISLVLLSTSLGVLLSLFVTRRFRYLTRAIGQFAEGDYTTRVEKVADDEVGLHARAFNDMAERIQGSIQALKEGDQLRRQLVANVYHDLRSPLGAMQSLLDSLHSEFSDLSEEDRRLFIERVLVNCTDLRGLVGDLYELSKLEAKTEKPRPEPISVLQLLRGAVKKFAVKAEEKDLAMIVDVPADFPSALGDEKMLNRVLSNLVENAIRYSDQGGEIRLAASPVEEGKVSVSVSDKGIGIPQEELGEVFSRLYRGAQAVEKEGSGSGLGLAIAREIIELHGQTISVQSVEGEGSSFSFTLDVVSRGEKKQSGTD